MDRIGGPLKDLLARLRLDDSLTGWKAVDLWTEVVGERVAARTEAVAFRDGTIVVEVQSAAWMNELSYMKHRLLADLNQRLGNNVVTDIRLVPKTGTVKDRASEKEEQ